MAFDEVRGHAGARAILARALAQQRLPPALLLTGPDGIGKRTLALALGRALVCVRGDGCGECSSCQRVDKAVAALPEARERARGAKDAAALNHRLHPDLILAEASSTTKEGKERAKIEIKVEQVRELVQESFGRPFEARARMFVIDDAHALNPSAANSLLKSLEEPPPTSHFVLASSAPQALLPTILSRCQVLRLQPLPTAELEAELRDRRGLSREEARLRASLADGSLGRALGLETGAYLRLRGEALGLLQEQGGAPALLARAERLAEADDQLPLQLLALRSLLRDVAALRAGVAPERLLNPDAADALAELAKGPLGTRAGELAERASESLLAIQGNASKLLEMDALVGAPELRR